MADVSGTYLVSDSGTHVAIKPPTKSRAYTEKAAIDQAIKSLGFVLIQPGHRVVLVELSPSTVSPLAARETLFQVRKADPECVLLTYAGDAWRRSKFEVFSPVKTALSKIERLARSASKRRAAGLFAGQQLRGDGLGRSSA
jgi:hypothetical protein